jgi:hypothetical protein
VEPLELADTVGDPPWPLEEAPELVDVVDDPP